MSVFTMELNVGATKPFTIVHITDTHLTLVDERDDERKNVLAQERLSSFPHAEAVLIEAGEIANRLNAPIIHTGDLIDFVSIANLERVKKFTDEHDCFMTAGNHEYSLYVGEAKEDAAYRAQSADKVQNSFKNDIRCSSRVINGVNFVSLDNGYYCFEKEQLLFLKKEAEKGLPIILLLHVPIYEPKLFDVLMYHRGKVNLDKMTPPCAYLMGVPEDLLEEYAEERKVQQMADELTSKAVDYIKTEPLIKAVITGHVHCNYEGELIKNVPQLMTSCTDIRIILVR